MTDAGRLTDDPEASGRLLFALALLAGALLRLVLLGRPDLFGADEGTWAVGARNLLEGGVPQFLGLSRTPLGEPSGTPVFFPVLLSVMVRIFGPVEWAIRLPSAYLGLLGALVLERIVRRGYGQPAGHIAGAFAALVPPFVAASRMATVEPTLVALGLGGTIFGLRAFEEDAPAEAALAGALFGLGFLAKGSAIGLFMLPLFAAIAARPALFGLGHTRRSVALLVGVFAAVGGSHLCLVALLRPSAFGYQLAHALGASNGALRSSAEPTAFGADLKTIIRSLFFVLPLVGAGIALLAREVSEPGVASGATGGERRLSHGVLWAVSGLELLAMVAVAGKLRLSSIPVMPAFSALAGLGGAALLSPLADRRRARREVIVALATGLLVLGAAAVLMQVPEDPLFGGRRSPFNAGFALGTIAATAAGTALLLWGATPRRVAATFLTALLLATGIEAEKTVRLDLLGHQTGARETAEQIAPALASLRPETLAFRAPEPEAFAFRLFRTGRSWGGVPSARFVEEEARNGDVRFWAFRETEPVGPKAPGRDVREWLEAGARDVTAEVDARAGRRTGLRVFVRR